jgi:hypothetical protein
MAGDARSAARRAGNHPLVERGARLGYAANGLVNLAIGGGGGGQEASPSGALRTLAAQPFGAALLWVILVGFALLALWQLATAVAGGETSDRVKAAGKAVTYGVLAGTTATIVAGSGGSGGSGGSAGLTASLMSQPFGRVLVALVGLGVAAVGAYHVVKGWTKKFLRDLQERPAPWVVTAGRAGYVARGIALVVVGGLFVAAAWTSDPQESQGLDGALQTMLAVPFGRVVLALVALGFIAYGVYSFARARYARV